MYRICKTIELESGHLLSKHPGSCQFPHGHTRSVELVFAAETLDENEKKILGFAGYDCTYKDFFGPTGVDETQRGKGIGGALFLRCMEAMRDEGYGYAIIGSAGPVDFYNKMSGAIVIENSSPGIYKELI